MTRGAVPSHNAALFSSGLPPWVISSCAPPLIMSHRYTLGLDQFLSRHGPSCFVSDLTLVHSSYDNLLHFAKAVPLINSTPSGFDLSEESRGWVDRLDGVVFVWRELFRDDESRILFVPFLSFDLVAL